jgi:hypothetical protein
MSDVARIGPADDGVLRFYSVYARRSADFSVIDTEFDCKALGGPQAEHEARKHADKLRRSKPPYDQIRISLCIIHPIMSEGFEDSNDD